MSRHKQNERERNKFNLSKTHPLVESHCNAKMYCHDLVCSLINVCQREIGYITENQKKLR